jgi:superfamily II DNA or RNA helicase
MSVNKPAWLQREIFLKLLEQNPIPECIDCQTRENLTIDHRKARSKGGSHELSNLAVRCFSCNRKKYTKDDDYWAKNNFYWDRKHDASKFNTAQLEEVYLKLLNEEYENPYINLFTRPWSSISGVIYLLAWIVGAGKTMAVPALAFALNRLILRELGRGYQRVDRVLVLTKEQGIRDQVAREYEEKITEFGICSQPPRVQIMESLSMFLDKSVVTSADVCVSCIQALWDKEPDPRLASILKDFPLIVVDEPHWALERVLQITEYAYSSLCFGLSGTPIEASGALMNKFVLFSVWDYLDAVINDQRLKFMDSQPNVLGISGEEEEVINV